MLVIPLCIIVDLSEMIPISLGPELGIIHFTPLQVLLFGLLAITCSLALASDHGPLQDFYVANTNSSVDFDSSLPYLLEELYIASMIGGFLRLYNILLSWQCS